VVYQGEINMFIEINGAQIETDPEGYLSTPEDWTPELAEMLAQRDNLELTPDHWVVINYMRDYLAEHGTAPNLRFLQKGLKDEYDGQWGDKKFLFDLFPWGPAKQAGRYAGAKKPTGCV
jgi:tRNA 2-thiouridine synthesizing protein E